MNEQVAKIEYNGKKVFFFAYDFTTGYGHADKFIERNKGKVEMKLYYVNNSPYRFSDNDRWRHIKDIGIDN